MAEHPWCRLVHVVGGGLTARSWTLDGPGRPDVGAVDDVARLLLAAARRNERVVLSAVAPDMGELLRLAALPVEFGIEVDREVESGEQPRRLEQVEEERHLGDLPS
jgi:hypothetical protein